jgi:hypothetical protein
MKILLEPNERVANYWYAPKRRRRIIYRVAPKLEEIERIDVNLFAEILVSINVDTTFRHRRKSERDGGREIFENPAVGDDALACRP